jgi:hypothetical protein
MKKTPPTAAANVEAKLSTISALLAQLVVNQMAEAGQKKRALALHNAGVPNAQIARVLGTSPEVIAVALYHARRERARPRRRAKAKRATRRRR